MLPLKGASCGQVQGSWECQGHSQGAGESGMSEAR